LTILILLGAVSSMAMSQENPFLGPMDSYRLEEDLEETSGLIYWEGSLWTHNDSKDNELYRINPANGETTGRIELEDVVNTDWEDIAQDADYLYLGDIGNNSGNRKDLQILRIPKSTLIKLSLSSPKKSSLFENSPEIPRSEIEFISFSYEDQSDYSSRPHATDFDCEAMVVHRGQIYLFTKEWISASTSVYSLPASPGHHIASKISEIPVEGLITGADNSTDEDKVILCGYNSLIQPFICVLEDPAGPAFKKILLSLPSHQVEGIAIKSEKEIYLSNEYLRLGRFLEVTQQVHLLEME